MTKTQRFWFTLAIGLYFAVSLLQLLLGFHGFNGANMLALVVAVIAVVVLVAPPRRCLRCPDQIR